MIFVLAQNILPLRPTLERNSIENLVNPPFHYSALLLVTYRRESVRVDKHSDGIVISGFQVSRKKLQMRLWRILRFPLNGWHRLFLDWSMWLFMSWALIIHGGKIGVPPSYYSNKVNIAVNNCTVNYNAPYYMKRSSFPSTQGHRNSYFTWRFGQDFKLPYGKLVNADQTLRIHSSFDEVYILHTPWQQVLIGSMEGERIEMNYCILPADCVASCLRT